MVTISTRTPDGTGNNTDRPDWGATGTALLRLGPVGYPDGQGDLPVGRPDPRSISNAVFRPESDMPNSQGASNMLWAWGQFIDHDITLTAEGHTEFAPIIAPAGDAFFTPGSMIPFERSEFRDGTGVNGVARVHENEITAFLDASMVYGSDAAMATALRGPGGLLYLTPDGFLPETDDDDGLLAGDVRAGENIALTSLHIVFVKEHNRHVRELAEAHPSLSADELYGAARARVEGLVQAITFNEFLPALVGGSALLPYAGYDLQINPGISTEFSTAAFRLGHSLLSPEIARLEENGQSVPEGPVALRDAFFQPDLLREAGGIDAVFRGLAATPAQELDAIIVEDVRSFLFGAPGAGGLDLAALNIQRGRDHGLSTYNELRVAMGLPPAADFSDISNDPAVQARLAEAYGSVTWVDAWVGGLAEDPVADGMLGPLFSAILVDQFSRLRDGDSQWSERMLDPDERAEIWSTSLADVIERNTDIDQLQDDVFVFYERDAGGAALDMMTGGTARDLLMGGDGNDMLTGHWSDDALAGGAGNDVLQGDTGGAQTTKTTASGSDVIMGGAGNDILMGGPEADIFSFGPGDDGMDIIKDFELGGDWLDLTDLGANRSVLVKTFEPLGWVVVFAVGEDGTSVQILLDGIMADEMTAEADLFV